MHKIFPYCLVFLLCVAQPVFGQAANKPIIKFTATEWPPYTSSVLPGQGFLSSVVKDTFADAGYIVQVDFSVWQRALATALASNEYVGTLVVYADAERREKCHFSKVVLRTTLGFVQHKEAPVDWRNLQDLQNLNIGTVMGYANTPEFDRLMAEGVLKVSAVHNDALNIRRVAFGRIDLAVMDKLTALHLLASNPALHEYREILEFNARPLGHPELYICLNRTEEGLTLKNAFDSAFDPQKAIDAAESVQLRLSGGN